MLEGARISSLALRLHEGRLELADESDAERSMPVPMRVELLPRLRPHALTSNANLLQHPGVTVYGWRWRLFATDTSYTLRKQTI